MKTEIRCISIYVRYYSRHYKHDYAASKGHTMWMCALSEGLTRTEPGRLGRTVQRPAAGANQGALYEGPNCNGILVTRFWS